MPMHAIGIFPVEADSAIGSLNFGFSMLDTDQSTPVALVQVPEASSLGATLISRADPLGIAAAPVAVSSFQAFRFAGLIQQGW